MQNSGCKRYLCRSAGYLLPCLYIFGAGEFPCIIRRSFDRFAVLSGFNGKYAFINSSRKEKGKK